ncbi:carbohydrate esterase family 5 protein [Macroventuria anomochaeta]|uniref:Carbohydrate esterase family 5 protein n=1 Tax=Macroventuria anomochaeta TaxID=301207 RepID=A0ACB6RRB8_9PLEO|nr:carbohydrate esterase family 5 protein [Macroventuria anomochaeta]KAF2623482.1 carbohydrate esterase family 5 protein [Macroventuria anomochaeta]
MALFGAVAFAQERCDAPYPNVYCNTTEILAYQSDDCKPYHVFIARGSDEPYPGRLGNITSEICKQIGDNDCSFENIEYPAKSTAWGKDEWCKSAGKGAANGQAQLKAYAEKCSESKLILLGFSQGAAVTQDIMGGGGGQVFECTQDTNPALDWSTSPGSRVIAAVTFGAVVRSKDQNFTVGEGVKYDGQRARTPEQLEALQKYSSVLLDYCHYGDPMCAVGSEPADVYAHLDYFLEHNQDVSKWIAGKAKGKAVSVSNQGQSASASTSVSPAKATTGVVTPTSVGSAAATGSAAEASQTSSSSNSGSTGAGSALSAGNYFASIVMVLGTTLFPVALLYRKD